LFSLKAGRKNKKTMGIHVLYLLLAYQATPAAQSSGLRRPSFKWTSTGFSAGKCRSQLAVPDLGFAAKTPLRCQNPVRIENIVITAPLGMLGNHDVFFACRSQLDRDSGLRDVITEEDQVYENRLRLLSNDLGTIFPEDCA
jgi:hypothetical protein